MVEANVEIAILAQTKEWQHEVCDYSSVAVYCSGISKEKTQACFFFKALGQRICVHLENFSFET